MNHYHLAAACAFTLTATLDIATPAAFGQDRAGSVLEHVVVTARKRQENLQETPIAITAISGDLIDETNMISIADIEQRAPNIAIRASDNGVGSALQAYMRGVGQFDFALTTDPGVGMYVDGVYLARTVGANLQLADIEQIQVLRGPQGTLFGKNTIGGAINVTTRRPSGETAFMAELTAGEDNYLSLDGYLEFPITDTTAGSIAFLAKESDGWQKRDRGDDAGNDGVWAIRGHLDTDISETWNSHLVVDFTAIDQNVYPQVLSDFNPDAVIASSYLGAVVAPTGQTCCDPNLDDIDRSSALNELDRDENDTWGVSWTNTWDYENLTFKSITGYRDMDTESYRDADNSTFDYFAVGSEFDITQFSQEFLVNNASGGKLDWLVGAYYLYEDGDHLSDVTIGGGLFEAIGVVPLDFTLRYDRTQETKSYAAFFNATYHLRDDLRLNLAARYTYEEKTLDMFTIKRASQTPVLLPGTTGAEACTDVIADGSGSFVSCDENWDEFTPKIGLDYAISDDVLTYASIATGFRSGIYNGRPTATAQVSVADPETLVSYEIGVKSQFWQDRMQLNAALFYNDYEDRQFLVNRPSGSAESALALIVDNAADSTLWGGEIEFTVLPFAGFTLTGGIAYIDPDYENFESFNTATGELEDLSDRPFANVPDWTANLLAQYEHDIGAGSLRWRADLAYKGDIFYTDDEASASFDRLHADAYTLYNAGLSYLTADEKWEIGVFGRNLSDKREIRGGFGVDVFGTTTVSFTEPRRFFFTVRYRG